MMRYPGLAGKKSCRLSVAGEAEAQRLHASRPLREYAAGVRRLSSRAERSAAEGPAVSPLREQLPCGLLTGPATASAEGIFTISLHQLNNYPAYKPPSSIDVHLEDGTNDTDYLAALDRALSIAITRQRPDLVVYIAGADPYIEDQLGGLAMTIPGLQERDKRVFRFAQTNQLPIVSVYAGGYARDVNDTVTIHTNTVLAAAEVFHFHGATSC